jgi:hypothetical protein
VKRPNRKALGLILSLANPQQRERSLNYMACAARLLMNSPPIDHTDKLGHQNRDFLLASILDNAEAAKEGVNVLSPYGGGSS